MPVVVPVVSVLVIQEKMFGAAGSTVIVEELLTGEEVSVSSQVILHLWKWRCNILSNATCTKYAASVA